MIFPVVCLCLIFFKITFFSKNIFQYNINKVSNSLDPDQVPRFVGNDLGPNRKKKLRPDLGSNCFQRHLQISFRSKNVSQLSGNLFLLINHFLGKKASSYECTRKIVFFMFAFPCVCYDV